MSGSPLLKRQSGDKAPPSKEEPREMKTLLLLRHAKTEPSSATGTDFDRALTERGISDATRVGEYVRAQGVTVDFIVSSSAKRAVQTGELFTKAAGLDLTVHPDRQIYEAGVQELLQFLKTVNSARDSVLLVGHNPAIENLLKLLTGNVQPMSAGTLAVLRFEGKEWSGLAAETCTLESIIEP